MSDRERELVAECRRALRDLAGAVETRRDHWRSLPAAVRRALDYTRDAAAAPPASPDIVGVYREVVETLTPYSKFEEMPFDACRRLVPDTLRLLERVRGGSAGGGGWELWPQIHALAKHFQAEAPKARKDFKRRHEARLMGELVKALDSLYPYADGMGDLLADDIRSALEICRRETPRPHHLQTLDKFRETASTDRRLRDELWNRIHSTVQQHMESAAAGLDPLREQFEEVIRSLRELPGGVGEDAADKLSAGLKVYFENEPTTGRLQDLAERLREAEAALPAAGRASYGNRSLPLHTRRFRVVIVEDNEQWMSFVLAAVEAVREILGDDFEVVTDCHDNVEDALKALLPRAAKDAQGPGEPSEDRVQTIAVLDMGLPADAAQAREARKGLATPDRENGHMLLREVREYRTNVPVVILTTPPYLLQDQLRACGRGVEDYHYVLKGPDKQGQVVEALLRLINRSQSHRVELRLDHPYSARVDGIGVPLSEMPFRTFYAICRLSWRTRTVYFTPAQILNELDSTFRDEYDYKRPPETPFERALVMARQKSGNWWGAKDQTMIANVIHLWAARKAESGINLGHALANLKKDYTVWREGLRLFDQYRKAHPTEGSGASHAALAAESFDAGLFAEQFDEVFGGLVYEGRDSYALHNIEDHVHQIRQTVHDAFAAAHRFIEPRRELLVKGVVDGGYGYRVLGNILFAKSDAFFEETGGEAHPSSDRPDAPYSVLVVENDRRYGDRIKELLTEVGYDVRVVTNAEDAATEASGLYRPDILCLDMHIPATRREYESDPESGNSSNGLRALTEIRKAVPEVRVVVPTTLHDRDDLREWASKLDVPVKYFVPKGAALDGAPWEGHLLMTVAQLRHEIGTGDTLPPLPRWLCPTVKIDPGTDMKAGRLNILVNGREFGTEKSKQGRLLAALLSAPGEVVSYRELDRYVQGKPATENTRKLWVKNVREKIRTDWLRLPDSSPERPELQILKSVEGGLVLNVYVVP